LRFKTRGAMSSAGAVVFLLLLALVAVSIEYISSTQSTSDQLSTQNQQVSSLQTELQRLTSEFPFGQGAVGANFSLPVMNQAPTIRTVRETWYLSTSAHQDRFDPAYIIANQGDTIRLTLIDNDTVAHDFVVGPPYNIIVNATVPGLVNDLTGEVFNTTSRNNSPGVAVTGTEGSVTATYAFEATHSGIFEFVCTYHAQVGMIGYLVVLPNAAFSSATATSESTSTATAHTVAASIVSGAVTASNDWFSPENMTVVIGVNATVTWTNDDTSIHTVTSTTVPTGVAPFDSGYLNQGQTFTYTFTKPGVYEYHCTIHPWMVGFVTVKAG
jgi:plastocyanin